jgi:hypothetical protein
MSGKNRVLCLVLLVLVCVAGCKTSKTVITVNPDGSGTVVFDVNFDRATEEQREKIRKQLGAEGVSFGLEEEKFRPWFPEPHFKISEYEFDTEKLTVHAEMSFTDINRLLVAKNANLLEMKGLDFTVDDGKLVFAVEAGDADGMGGMVRKGEEALPVIREIVIVNGQTEESVRFYEEMGGETDAVDWDGSLDMKGHTIERVEIKRNFAGYPVIKLDGRVHEASWSLHKTPRSDWSNLDITVEAAIPQGDGAAYIGWSEPVLMSGGYVPEQEMDLTRSCQGSSRKFINNFGPKAKSGYFMLPLEFNYPTLPATSITDTVVRVKALRAMGSKRYKLGRIEPETKYEAGGISFKSGKAERKWLRFSIDSKIDMVKRFSFHTERGSQFALKEGSTSTSGDGGSIGLRIFMPLDKGDVYVELYDQIDHVWIDVNIDGIDFENSAAKDAGIANGVDGVDFREAVAGELDEPLEGFGEEVFASKENMAAFFRSVPDEKLLSAVAQAADSEFMLGSSNEAWMWYQNVVGKELGSRKEYLEGNKKQIAEKLFSLYMYLPSSKKGLVQYLPSNLYLGSYIHDKVVAAIEQGNYEIAHESYFSEEVTVAERAILTKAFYAAPSPYSWLILNILLSPENFELEFAEMVLNDKKLDEPSRSKALHSIFKHGDVEDLSFLKEYIENPDMRVGAVQGIWILVQSADRAGTVDVVSERLKPLLPMLQDLAEYPNLQQKDAVKILDKIRPKQAASETSTTQKTP